MTIQNNIPRIRGKRYLLLDLDLETGKVFEVAMGRSRDLLLNQGRNFLCPAVVEIDADETTKFARRGVLPVDNNTIADAANDLGISKRTFTRALKGVLRNGQRGRTRCDAIIKTWADGKLLHQETVSVWETR